MVLGFRVRIFLTEANNDLHRKVQAKCETFQYPAPWTSEVPNILTQYPKTDSRGSMGSIILGILGCYESNLPANPSNGGVRGDGGEAAATYSACPGRKEEGVWWGIHTYSSTYMYMIMYVYIYVYIYIYYVYTYICMYVCSTTYIYIERERVGAHV